MILKVIYKSSFTLNVKYHSIKIQLKKTKLLNVHGETIYVILKYLQTNILLICRKQIYIKEQLHLKHQMDLLINLRIFKYYIQQIKGNLILLKIRIIMWFNNVTCNKCYIKLKRNCFNGINF